MAGFLPLDALLLLTNIGTLFAFVIVCLAVLIMRKRYPNAERPFRCPWVPFVPVMGVLCCLMLMFSLPAANWFRLLVWMVIGLCIYFFYGRKHSVMTTMRLQQELAQHGTGGAYVSGTHEGP
jgi:APA family basic amino acid/polyamine antiporter